MFLPLEPALIKFSWSPASAIRLKLSPSSQSPAAVTNQRGPILTNQDSASWINQTGRIWHSHLLENRSTRDQGSVTSVPTSQLSSTRESTLSLSAKEGRSCFPDWAETPQRSHLKQYGVEQREADHHRAEQNFLESGVSTPWAAWGPTQNRKFT